MGDADHRPFGAHVLDFAQQELAEASGLLDLYESSTICFLNR